MGVWLLSMTLVAAGLLFLVLSASTPDPWGFGPRGANLVLAATLSTVAAIITTRRPEAAVGWVLGAAGVVAAVTGFGSEYRIYAVLASPGAPAGAVVAWIVEWVWPLLIGVLAVVFLLFPDDGLRSSRWRPLLWLTAAGMLMASTGSALAPGPLTEFPVVDNPLWSGEGSTLSRRVGFAGGVATAGMVVLVITFVAAGVVLVLRFRGARGERRQQLKWMTFVGALAVGAFFFSVMWFLLGAPPAAVQWLTVCALSMIPVAIGLAVLKYRLYDIDRIVNRTIVYAVVTALLGTVYAMTVLILGNLFGTVGGDVPSWVVAVATLTVAAAFQPARRHVQAVVDLRFNRRNYDATRTLGAFVALLRDELDADVVGDHLLSAARQTMQPTHISVWLRSPSHEPADVRSETQHNGTGQSTNDHESITVPERTL